MLQRAGGKGDGGAVQRAGLTWEADRQVYIRDRLARQSEPISAALLELSKLRQYKALQYTPSRNRQWHMYSAVERPDARSYPLRRLFVRGTVRQLGHPALLAASYSGNGAAVAAAAVAEVEEGLSAVLEELSRLQSSIHPQSQASPSGGDSSLAGRPDWTHVFVNVLPPLPSMHPSPSFSTDFGAYAPLRSSVTTSQEGAGAAEAEDKAAAADARVAASLKASMASLIARHKTAFRAAAVSQLEVRMRPAPGGGCGEMTTLAAWRVIVSLATGHEHGEEHVEVYREEPRTSASSTAQSGGGGGGGEAAFGDKDCPLGPHGIPLVFKHHSAADPGATMRPASSFAGWLATPSSSAGSSEAKSGGALGLHGLPVLGPYPPLEPLQQRRLAARRHAVTYCYDFPSVFEDALRELWAARAGAGEPSKAGH